MSGSRGRARLLLLAGTVALLAAGAGASPLLPIHRTTGTEDGQLIAVRRGWRVMGTLLEIDVYRPPGSEDQATEDARAAYGEVVDVDRRMSLYREDSELSRLNRRAGEGPVPVDEPLLTVLQAAVRYGALSDGALDVTVQPLVDLWGFYVRGEGGVPSTTAIERALERVGHERIEIDRSGGTVELAPGTHVDLGAIAKGYAVDRALDALRRRDVPAALVNLGGNVGVVGLPPEGTPWEVSVRHPRDGEHRLGRLRLDGGAVATSGDYERFFEIDGERYSHIIDPRTGWPVQGVHAVTVVAPTGMEADALSTAAFVLGPEGALDLVASRDGVEALVVVPAERRPAGAGSSGSPPPSSGPPPLTAILSDGLGGASPRFLPEPDARVEVRFHEESVSPPPARPGTVAGRRGERQEAAAGVADTR